MKAKIIWDDMEQALRNLGLQLTQIDYTPGRPPEIKADLLGIYDFDGIYFYSAEDCRTRFPKQPKRKPIPKKVIFSGPATTILWKDATKTTVKCQDEDVWDDNVGIAMCYLKKMLGNKGNYNNIFREAMKVAEARYKPEELSSTEGSLSLYEAALKNFNKKWNEAMESLTKEEK